MALKRSAPYVMTWSQMAEYVATQARAWLAANTGMCAPPVTPYTPRFNQGVSHFLIHAGEWWGCC
jgi:hypothetical protein